MITDTNIVHLFRKITEESVFLKKFIACRYNDFNSQPDKIYPMLFLELDSIKRGYKLSDRQSFRSYDIGFFLLSNYTNIADINEQYLKEVSSLEQVGQSILQYLYTKLPPSFAQIDTDATSLDYLTIFQDSNIALRFDIVLKAPFSINTCDAYFNEPFNSDMYEHC